MSHLQSGGFVGSMAFNRFIKAPLSNSGAAADGGYVYKEGGMFRKAWEGFQDLLRREGSVVGEVAKSIVGDKKLKRQDKSDMERSNNTITATSDVSERGCCCCCCCCCKMIRVAKPVWTVIARDIVPMSSGHLDSTITCVSTTLAHHHSCRHPIAALGMLTNNPGCKPHTALLRSHLLAYLPNLIPTMNRLWCTSGTCTFCGSLSSAGP